MFVLRVIATYKMGMMEEAATVISNELRRVLGKFGYGELRSARILTPMEEQNIIIGEYEFDSVAQNERFWENWNADPESQPFMQKHDALLDGEPIRERMRILNLDDYQV